jgi:hypothetical protein
MRDRVGFEERRSFVRVKRIYPAIYSRLDKGKRPFDEKPSRSLNLSLGGLRLQSVFPVNPKEVLDIDMALEHSLASYRGEVVYVIRSDDESFEFGIAIKEIQNGDRMA